MRELRHLNLREDLRCPLTLRPDCRTSSQVFYGNTVFIDHMKASRNSDLISGRAAEGDTDGQIEPFAIVGRDCRASWSLRLDWLRRLKRDDILKIRYV